MWNMKRLFIFLLLAVVGAGCATHEHYISYVGREDVKVKNPGEHMFVSGDGHKAWYSALELEQIARNYAKQEGIAFDFSGVDKAIRVYTEGLPILATVSFTSTNYFQVDIDRFGKPMRYRTGVWNC
jgi:hypothetical protein